jgi:hypothetical protein
MGMRARFGVALSAGLLLGLAVVGSNLLYSSSVPAAMSPAAAQERLAITAASTSTNSVEASGGVSEGSNLTYSYGFPSTTFPGPPHGAANYSSSRGYPFLASQVHNMARQPPVMSLVVLLPVLAALFFGVIVYRFSLARQQGEHSESE